MAFNVAGAVEVPLSTFAGLVTEMAPVDLPEGVSPDNQDVVYVPGSVASRPALQKVFGTPFAAGGPSNFVPTVTYAKSFVAPNGAVKNLYFDSNGVLYVEDFTNAPGVYTTLFTSTPGCYAKSITAFGREYIAISDGLHGQEAPLQFDGTNLDRVTQDGPGAAPSVASLALAGAAIVTLVRNAGVVTVACGSAHNLKVGYQVQISSVPGTHVGSGIASIVISNENSPGVATITTNAAHGLVPGNFVQPFGIVPVAVGSGITSIVRSGQVVTVTTSAAHSLAPGAEVTIAGVTTASFNGTFPVAAVPTPQSFTYLQADVDASDSTGTVSLVWPVPGWTNFEVLSAPTSTSFQVAISYTDGTWTATGQLAVFYDGTFYVATVQSSTVFTYLQAAPNTSSGGGASFATPFGQAAPGVHQLQVSFLTRQGAITRPSPPVSFTANGGQYLSLTNIPIGPSNVVARILEFTGAGGAYFFYIPVAPQVNGQLVGTATQINDNTTTSITLDFSDNTLFAALATSIPGNNLANQIVLEGALGFGSYGSRLLAYGQRNRIQNLLNLGFDGGWLASATTLPLGWTSSNTGGALAAGHIGKAWQISPTSSAQYGNLAQSLYEDAYGGPIAQPSTAYKLRAWLKPSAAVAALSFTATITSASLSFTSTLTILGTAMNVNGSFVEANFSLATPASIPSDLTLTLYASASSGTPTLLIDELSILYVQTPYLDTVLFGSYVNNPEGFDGVSGKFGPSTDTRKVMDFGVIRDTLYVLTQEPSGRLHQTANNGVTEPAGWQVSEVGANCGALSAFSVTRSQADDGTASGGEEWFSWASSSGARMFGGDQPWKISQEIQPDWAAINPAAQLTVWAVNDPVARVIYFGLPTASATAPSLVYPVNYRELDSAYQIAMSAPVHTSFSGKLIATDATRKWTRWNLKLNGAALMYRAAGQLSVVFFAGNAQAPGAAAGFGNVYTLNAALLTDQDYGAIASYYTTYFFVNHEQEQALQLGSHRKMLVYLTAFVSGTGDVTIRPLIDALANPWALAASRPLSAAPTYDLEWTGANATGQRMAFQISAAPCPPTGTDNAFNLQKLVVTLRPAARLPVRGAAAADTCSPPATFWLAGNSYTLGQTLIDPSGHTQKVTTAGTSGTNPPSWNDSGGTTTDGTGGGAVIWTDQGIALSAPPGVLFDSASVSGFSFQGSGPWTDALLVGRNNPPALALAGYLAQGTVFPEWIGGMPQPGSPGNVSATVTGTSASTGQAFGPLLIAANGTYTAYLFPAAGVTFTTDPGTLNLSATGGTPSGNPNLGPTGYISHLCMYSTASNWYGFPLAPRPVSAPGQSSQPVTAVSIVGALPGANMTLSLVAYNVDGGNNAIPAALPAGIGLTVAGAVLTSASPSATLPAASSFAVGLASGPLVSPQVFLAISFS